VNLRFLGTGTSFGVPVIGCRCGTCTSDDPRDRRTRHGALVTDGGRSLLVDTPPELRLQLVAAGVERVDAVWFTHCHADHVHGLDDLRVFSERTGDAIQVWGSAECVETLMSERFAYVFDPAERPTGGHHQARRRC
jgi:phosphoribosyl 1,2-cyclic phosphate phosphodiesterase